MNKSRLTMLAAALAIFAPAPVACAQASGGASAEPQPLAPRLEFVFEEFVTLGAGIHPGATPFGERNIVPITGGVFSGPKIHGKVMSGGWDWQLGTSTGCFQLRADYMLQADDGAIINVVNKGTMCKSAGPDAKLYTAPVFEAPLGPHEWLNSGAYIGTLDSATFEGKPAVHIRFYQVK